MRVLFGEDSDHYYPSLSKNKYSYISMIVAIGFITDISIKTNLKDLDDNSSGIKPRHFSQRQE